MSLFSFQNSSHCLPDYCTRGTWPIHAEMFCKCKFTLGFEDLIFKKRQRIFNTSLINFILVTCLNDNILNVLSSIQYATAFDFTCFSVLFLMWLLEIFWLYLWLTLDFNWTVLLSITYKLIQNLFQKIFSSPSQNLFIVGIWTGKPQEKILIPLTKFTHRTS